VAQRFRQQSERDELLSRRYKGMECVFAMFYLFLSANESTAVTVGDAELEQHQRLRGAHNQMDEMIDHGHAVLRAFYTLLCLNISSF
jgi:hypothetical protein